MVINKRGKTVAECLAEFVAFDGHRNGYDEYALIQQATRALKREAPEVLKKAKAAFKAALKEGGGGLR